MLPNSLDFNTYGNCLLNFKIGISRVASQIMEIQPMVDQELIYQNAQYELLAF